MSIEEKRRAAFELHIEKTCPGMFIKEIDLARDEFGEYKYEPAGSDWKTWNAALDSICVELPLMDCIVDEDGFMHDSMRADEVKEALTAAGVPYK